LGFLDDISVEVLVHKRFICIIWCCLTLFFSGYHTLGAVKCLGQSIVYEVLLDQYAVPNECAGSGSVIQLISFLFLNMHESQGSEHTEMLQPLLFSDMMPGLIWSPADNQSRQGAVLEIDRH
jgi:hypothetical protein